MSGNALLIGANGGIGAAIARSLAADGYRLTLASRDRARLEEVAAALETEVPSPAAGGVRVEVVDVTDEESVRRVVLGAAGEEGLEVAVNNAGAGHRPAVLHELDAETVDRVFAVTATGVLRAMRHELAVMRDGGRLVNVASSAGLDAAPGMAAYVAAKHAVVGMTRTAAVDYGDRGIRVNAVAPGPVDSGGIARQPEEVRARIGAVTRLGRLGRPEDVAAAVSWLVSPGSAFVTGSVVPVDGGKTVGRA